MGYGFPPVVDAVPDVCDPPATTGSSRIGILIQRGPPSFLHPAPLTDPLPPFNAPAAKLASASWSADRQ